MPPKALWLEMETTDLEFEHFLCLKIGGMTLGEMRQRMSNEEYEGWKVFHGRKAQKQQLANGGGAG